MPKEISLVWFRGALAGCGVFAEDFRTAHAVGQEAIEFSECPTQPEQQQHYQEGIQFPQTFLFSKGISHVTGSAWG